jgi:hypothetical protein
MHVLATGSNGLTGPEADTRWNQRRPQTAGKHFRPVELDIRDRQTVLTQCAS